MPVVTLADIEAARDRIAGYLPRTPLISTGTLSKRTGTRLSLKAENLQKTGSFKVRGALNSVLQLTAEQRARGIVTMSAGNHGAGVAYAAALVGVKCAVFMPEFGVPAKIAAIKGYGAEVHFAPTMQALKAAMEAHRDAYGMEVVHPFADPNTIAGQGTVGLEILEDCPDVEAIVIGTGGGGLLCRGRAGGEQRASGGPDRGGGAGWGADGLQQSKGGAAAAVGSHRHDRGRAGGAIFGSLCRRGSSSVVSPMSCW